jgi:hypothetical protein
MSGPIHRARFGPKTRTFRTNLIPQSDSSPRPDVSALTGRSLGPAPIKVATIRREVSLKPAPPDRFFGSRVNMVEYRRNPQARKKSWDGIAPERSSRPTTGQRPQSLQNLGAKLGGSLEIVSGAFDRE